MTGITLNESLDCPDFSGDRSCVSSSEASGPRCCRTNQSFLGLAVYYVFVFWGHTQVSDPLTGVRRFGWTSWCYQNTWEEKPQDPMVPTWADGACSKWNSYTKVAWPFLVSRLRNLGK